MIWDGQASLSKALWFSKVGKLNWSTSLIIVKIDGSSVEVHVPVRHAKPAVGGTALPTLCFNHITKFSRKKYFCPSGLVSLQTSAYFH